MRSRKNFEWITMRQLTPAGQQLIEEVAQRHGFSTDAVMSMLESVIRGNCSMAQFNHPEFGGSGQWMLGGMTMVSDMFNNSLKGQVHGLCSELSRLIANQPDLMRRDSFQTQSQGTQMQRNDGSGQHHWQSAGDRGSSQQQTAAGPAAPESLFVPAPPGTSGDWWPADLGRPNSTGAQNDVRYAYFAQPRRLAIEVNGKMTVYDTLAHQINGFSQQQSSGASLTFTSQHGLVAVANLPVISVGGVPQQTSPWVQEKPVNTQPDAREADVFATIEKLAQLHAKGILSNEEFAAKKAELLSRL
jgi:Short C-terminal domain